MDRESIAARIRVLKNQEAELKQKELDARMGLYAVDGAIQDCEYWLRIIENETQEISDDGC